MKTNFPSALRLAVAFTLLELMVVTGVLVILFLLVVPMQHRHRKPAQQINCANNLKQVGLSFRLWAGDNGEKYPIQALLSTNEPWFQQRALSDGTGAAYTYQVFQIMSNELGTPKIVVCPADGDRSIATNFAGDFSKLANQAISYFVGKDADEATPNQFLAGDRNIGIRPADGWSGNDPDGGVTGFSPNSSFAGTYRSLAVYTNDTRLQWTDKLHQAKGNVVLADGSVQQMTSAAMRKGLVQAGDPEWLYFP